MTGTIMASAIAGPSRPALALRSRMLSTGFSLGRRPSHPRPAPLSLSRRPSHGTAPLGQRKGKERIAESAVKAAVWRQKREAGHRWALAQRAFHTSPPRRDILGFGVFACNVPMVKSYLLSLTRASLLVLPFWYRWRLSRRFPRASRTLWTIPVFAFCLIVALGIDQSPRTARWRLLLMTEREEMEWSHRRFEDILASEGGRILPEDDERVQLVKRICDRLITALDIGTPVSAAVWPRDTLDVKERMKRIERRQGVQPSAKTASALMPFRPETSNPEKVLEGRDWDLFIVDLPKINAFVLPSREIFVYTGLLDLLDQDEHLCSAILAHEVSHVTERHAVENMGFSALSAVAFDVVRGISFAFTMSFPMVSDGLAAAINYVNDVVAERAYSRKLESEADELGIQIMARAGYDPRAALALWGLLNEVEEEQRQNGQVAWGDQAPWTRTHPTGRDRQKAIEKALPKAMKLFRAPMEPAVVQSCSPEPPRPPPPKPAGRDKPVAVARTQPPGRPLSAAAAAPAMEKPLVSVQQPFPPPPHAAAPRSTSVLAPAQTTEGGETDREREEAEAKAAMRRFRAAVYSPSGRGLV